jgi:outer membrane protein TolC
MAKVADKEIDLSNNSSLRQIDMQTNMIGRQRKILKSAFIPTIALVGNYQLQSISNTNWNIAKYNWSNAASVALSVSIPIFKAKNFTSLKSNEIQLFQLAETRNNTENMLKMQAQSFIDNMTTSSEQLSSNKEAVRLAEKGVEISQKRYDIGNGTILELTNSQVQLTNTRLSYNNTIYDYLVAKSELNKVLGKE